MKKANSFGIFKTFLFFLPTLQLKKLWLKTLMSNLIRFLLLTILFVSVYGVHKKKIVKNNANIWICMGHAFFAVWFFFNNFLLTDATDRIFLKVNLYPLSFFANIPFNVLPKVWIWIMETMFSCWGERREWNIKVNNLVQINSKTADVHEQQWMS